MKYVYNQKNVGVAFVIMGGFLFFLVAGELAIKLLFILLSLVCIDYGLRLMGNPSLWVTIQSWFDKLRT
jgi:hypothetical protein